MVRFRPHWIVVAAVLASWSPTVLGQEEDLESLLDHESDERSSRGTAEDDSGRKEGDSNQAQSEEAPGTSGQDPTRAKDAGPAAAAQAPEENAAAPRPARRRAVEEIVVTATRRAENVQDIASSIQVFDGAMLEKIGAEGFQDYVFRVPGADVVDNGADRRIAIRGISNVTTRGNAAGASTSPIGLYLNDTPIQGNGVLPDMDLYDLKRIEVLKGPQGTLYGEGSQGGAIRMLVNRADPLETLVKADFGVGQTKNGEGLDNFQKVALNAPIVRGKWGVRLVGTRRADTGFVDYFNVPDDAANESTNLMGRVHVDGEIWDGFGAGFMVLHQRSRVDQFPAVQLAEGDLRNRHTEPQFADTDFTLGDLTLDYDLGFAGLTSSTSGFVNDRQVLTRHQFVGPTVFVLLNPATGDADLELGSGTVEEEWLETDNRQSGIAQELRLVSTTDFWVDWTAGFFYRTRENDFDFFINNSATDDVPPPAGPGVVRYIGVESFDQIALFGEATIDLPWRFELGLGLRGFREDVALDGVAFLRGPFYPVAVAAGRPDAEFPEDFDISTTAFTPKVSLSWFADEWRMLYTQVANGVRSGGTNHNALVADVTPLFEPDSLWSYEVGAKTQWLDGAFTANLAAFHNSWSDMQVQSAQSGQVRGGGPSVSVGVILNAARAFTRGVELELVALPIEDLTLGFNLFVGEGEITEGDAEGEIADNSPVPQLADVSYSAFGEYVAGRWPVFGFVPSLRYDTQATGDRMGFVPVLGSEWPLDGFQTHNASLGLVRGRWDVSFAVRNLTDERPQLGVLPFDSDTLTIGRPRSWIARLGVAF